MPDVFAEWLCVDAQDIIRATSHKSFIFQFKVIGIYQLGELAVLEELKSVNVFISGMRLIL